ncbi:MAG TPA: hypothetical protein VIY48_18310 [Candidatus Paceibacterota bacterium]
MKKAISAAAATLFALPLIAAAQTPSNLTTLISFVGDTLNRVIPVLIAAAVVVFFWGLVKYILGGKGLKAGKNIMIAGLLALFIMVSFWGIIRLMQNTLGVNGAVPVTIPQVPQR